MRTEKPIEPLLKVGDVAVLLNVHERTLRRWVQAGKIVAVDTGDELRFEPSAVRQYIEQRRTSPPAEAES